MKKQGRITLAVLLSVLVIGLFAVTCFFTYKNDWSQAAFWWSWIGSAWFLDVAIGLYLFYKPNRTDETKTFWLFVMVLLPVVGAIDALIFNIKSNVEYAKPNNDHAKLQSAIFQARSTIKFYSDSFFVSHDTLKALTFATWKGVEVTIIISTQQKKVKQDLLVYNIQKHLEHKIMVYFINKPINETFLLTDDKNLIVSKKNFNFQNIYADNNITNNSDISGHLQTWEHDLERSSLCSLEREKINPFKKAFLKVINIFYPFF